MFGLPADDPFYDEEVTGIDKPIGDIPVSDAIGKAPVEEKTESYLDKQQATTEKVEQVEQKEGEEKPVTGLALTDDTMILDDRDGVVKPWSAIKGLASLKKDTDAQIHSLQRERSELDKVKGYVDSNKPFIDAIGSSDFAITLANSLKMGIPEDQAIAAAFAASGKANPMVPQQKVDADPEPAIPDDFNANDPQHLLLAQKHMAWEQRKIGREYAEAAIAPLKAELEAIKQREAAQVQAQTKAAAAAKELGEYNRGVLSEGIPLFIDFDPKALSPEDQSRFWTKFDEAGAKLGIPVQNHRLSIAEIRGIMAEVAPQGTNPFVQPVRKIDKSAITDNKKPLSPGTAGGTQAGASVFASEKDRVQAILEGMATGKPAEAGVPVF